MSPGTDNLAGQNSLFTKEQIITYVFRFIALGLLIFSIMNFNSWRLIDPGSVAEATVAKQTGLSRQQQSQLYQAQFDKAVETKSGYARQGILFLVLALLFYAISNKWSDWRDLYGEQMLYGYAFVIPPVGWILYLFAYPVRGDPNRKIIRRNIGIMSLSLVIGGAAFLLVYLLQEYLLKNIYTPGPETNLLVAGIFGFLISLQLAQFVGIGVGGFVAFRTRDVRAIAVAAQLVFLGVVLAVAGWMGTNASIGMAERGLSATDYTFLDLTAGFDISETLTEYDRSSTYGDAFLTGALNTLMVSVVGIFLASMLGLLVGVSRLSTNWLISTIARVFVELMRNIPLLVILFFLYAGVLLQLPQRADTITMLSGNILLNNRGLALTWPTPTATFSNWMPFLIAGVVIGIITWFFYRRTYKVTGRPAFSFWFVLLGLVVVPIIGLFIVSPLSIQKPFIDGLNYAKDDNRNFIGLVLSPEFFGLLLGLVLYTGGYIGEVVRAGLQAVSRGQIEAAGAIGLSKNQSLRLIILPQALRVIIPPLTNQYLNLAKNSSLAIAVGYPDLFFVANTTFNQSGQSVQVVLMIMLSYLTMSLFISALMNFLNKQVQIKER